MMEVILKISAGVLIGLLAYQIIIYKNVNYQIIEYQKEMAYKKAIYEDQVKIIGESQALKKYFMRLTGYIAAYYRKNKLLPKFVSDLQCSHSFRNGGAGNCAVLSEGGVFYVNYDREWMSVEPYILDGKLYSKCKSSVSLSVDNGIYQDCGGLNVDSIPEKKYPPFDCSVASYDVEKIICLSDKLIDGELRLSEIYKNLLEQSSVDKKRQIIDSQRNFINLRRNTCVTSDCINEMTMKRISRLRFLGV